MKVEITYFKPSGKFYTSGTFEYTGPWYDVGTYVRRLNDERKLPGLNPGDWGGPIYLNSDEAYPMLVNLTRDYSGAVTGGRVDTSEEAEALVERLTTGDLRHTGGGLTADEVIVACRNIGINLECGGCAAIFYTGIGGLGADHDEHCTTTLQQLLMKVADHLPYHEPGHPEWTPLSDLGREVRAVLRRE